MFLKVTFCLIISNVHEMDVMFGFVFVPGTKLQILTGKLKKNYYMNILSQEELKETKILK